MIYTVIEFGGPCGCGYGVQYGQVIASFTKRADADKFVKWHKDPNSCKVEEVELQTSYDQCKNCPHMSTDVCEVCS